MSTPVAVNPCSVPDFLRFRFPLETPAQQEACRKHDVAYERGGSRADRLRADLQFGLDLLDADMDPDDAEAYVFGVRAYGGRHWSSGDHAGGAIPRPQEEAQAP